MKGAAMWLPIAFLLIVGIFLVRILLARKSGHGSYWPPVLEMLEQRISPTIYHWGGSGRIFAERGPLRRHARRPLGDAAELYGSLGNFVHVVLHVFVDLVE